MLYKKVDILKYKDVETQTLLFSLYKWMWLSDYYMLPFELVFALQDAIKYIQFIYIAKWVRRKYLIIAIGAWFTFLGIMMVFREFLAENDRGKQGLHYLVTNMGFGYSNHTSSAAIKQQSEIIKEENHY